MPEIILKTPENSRFSSSLNEIDLCLKEVFLKEMRIADPRDKTHLQPSVGSDNHWLWDEDHVFQVDDLTTEDIFDTWLLRNTNKSVDVQYPLLAFKQNNIDTVYWGTGNRYDQWNIASLPVNSKYEVGDEVVIVSLSFPLYRGIHGIIEKIGTDKKCYLTNKTTGAKIKDINNKQIGFEEEELRHTGKKTPITYKAKAITGTYDAVILVSTRDEAQYIRDKFILRCCDANIWFTYSSPILNNVQNQIYTVFGIPNLERYPSATDKLKGKGYIYGLGFNVNVWATVTDTPIPEEVIELIRMNMTITDEKRTQRIIIN